MSWSGISSPIKTVVDDRANWWPTKTRQWLAANADRRSRALAGGLYPWRSTAQCF
jgi:hypothetical protein